MKYCYGVDLGGTVVKLGFFDTQGRLIKSWEIATDRSDGGRNIPGDISAAVLGDMARRGLSRENCLGVGIGVPGQVYDDGTVDAENLDWARFPLIGGIESATGLPAFANNDANAAAAGESWQGGGKGYRSMVLITLGTGVGGGIIIDGKCLRGAHLIGGEIGHIPLDPGETLACACGGCGCLEQYASATGCARIARELLASTDAPSVLRDVPRLDARAVWNAAKAGDALAMAAADKFCMYLGRGIAAVTAILDPEAVVIGGGVSKAGEPLIRGAARYYRMSAFNACKDTPIVLATLGNNAGIYGCASMVLSGTGYTL